MRNRPEHWIKVNPPHGVVHVLVNWITFAGSLLYHMQRGLFVYVLVVQCMECGVLLLASYMAHTEDFFNPYVL